MNGYRWTDIPLFLLGIIVVVASGHYFVEEASVLARYFGLSEWVIGVTIHAFIHCNACTNSHPDCNANRHSDRYPN